MSNRKPLTPEEREEHEASLREPEPPSHWARWGTLIWIGITCTILAAVAKSDIPGRSLPRALFCIAAGSYALYRYAAHQNRTGDRSFD